ncbi:MAG TPA: glycosyltransferase family A protein, partial [Blastocatellia bacterium]
MTRSPLVSVIIPCYNQGRFLADAIESALEQSYRPIEIVVVDDGSSDESSRIAARYADVKLIRQSNQGLS